MLTLEKFAPFILQYLHICKNVEVLQNKEISSSLTVTRVQYYCPQLLVGLQVALATDDLHVLDQRVQVWVVDVVDVRWIFAHMSQTLFFSLCYGRHPTHVTWMDFFQVFLFEANSYQLFRLMLNFLKLLLRLFLKKSWCCIIVIVVTQFSIGVLVSSKLLELEHCPSSCSSEFYTGILDGIVWVLSGEHCM